MCASMADIQFATAEIRRGKKKERKKERRKKKPQGKHNVPICYAGGHNKRNDKYMT